MKFVFILILLTCVSYSRGQLQGEPCSAKMNLRKDVCVRKNECFFLPLMRPGQIQNCDEKDIVCCPKERKSRYKCQEYYPQDKYLLVTAGIKAEPKEFPHMAAIGFGEEPTIQWLCGGTLISDQFVLTAAHCLSSREVGPAKWVRLGDLDLKESTEDAKPLTFEIVETFGHPEYKRRSHYHDIALLKLNASVTFNNYIKPACLDQGIEFFLDELVITGWGKVDLHGDFSSHLLKAKVNLIEHERCKELYASTTKRKLEKGIVEEWQLCAGGDDGQDSCPGDSGGPLQHFIDSYPQHFFVVGVTSFGKGCGFKNSVGVYTRVSNYIDWIDDIVWPDEDVLFPDN